MGTRTKITIPQVLTAIAEEIRIRALVVALMTILVVETTVANRAARRSRKRT